MAGWGWTAKNPFASLTVVRHPSSVASSAGDHDNRQLARFQRGCHGGAPGDRWQDPVRPHQGPEHRLCRGISDGARHRSQGSAGGRRRGRAIIDAVNALRHRYTYVFTTGGIGPTPRDIPPDCVAKAFGVPIDSDPRALAILHEWVKTTGAEMNEARLRMTRIPKGAELILNRVSGAPGFWIDNVIVMAGVPSIMQAMLDEVAPK